MLFITLFIHWVQDCEILTVTYRFNSSWYFWCILCNRKFLEKINSKLQVASLLLFGGVNHGMGYLSLASGRPSISFLSAPLSHLTCTWCPAYVSPNIVSYNSHGTGLCLSAFLISSCYKGRKPFKSMYFSSRVWKQTHKMDRKTFWRNIKISRIQHFCISYGMDVLTPLTFLSLLC